MCDPLRSLLQFLGGMNWVAIVQGAIGIWMATIATRALHTWKRQIKAKKHIEFIDTLTDTIHDFVLSMWAPVSSLRFAKIEIDCYVDTHDKSENAKKAAAVAFITARGKSTGEDIRSHLDVARPILSKMMSLTAKGQIFGIRDYSKCKNACEKLTRSYKQIEAFSYFIGSQHLNWEHPDVQQALDAMLSIDPEQIDKNLDDQNVEFLLFAKQAYTILK